jgi:hypothetical protein
MASKHSTRKNTSGQNQPPLRKVTNSLSNKPLEFPTFDPSRRYCPHIPSQTTPDPTYTSSPETPNPNLDPSQTTPDPTYTSSPETPNPNLDPSLIEDLCSVTPDEPVFLVPNKEVNDLHQHTHAYLQSIGQIPVIYKIPRARSSHRRTQPSGENQTLDSIINDFIIDTISEII